MRLVQPFGSSPFPLRPTALDFHRYIFSLPERFSQETERRHFLLKRAPRPADVSKVEGPALALFRAPALQGLPRMRRPTPHPLVGRSLSPWLAALAACCLSCGLARAQTSGASPDPPGAIALEERLRRVEEVNARLLERLDRDRHESDRRYRELEERYLELKQHAGEPRRDARPTPEDQPGQAGEDAGRTSHLGRPGELGRAPASGAVPLETRLADGFQLASQDDEFDLRFHVLDQTDFKLFAPNDRTFGKSGLYIPRVRVYLEGRLTRFWDYEVSLQRSLEGTWDLLDGNLNFHPSDAFQIKFGRQLVPYSYAWFDNLEQYFIAPDWALFPLNFWLSRQYTLMAWGKAREGRLDWALGGFNGHLTGLADNNPNQEAVGYLNFRPFLHSERLPALRQLNLGASGAIGEVARNQAPLPMRTSVQAAENDEAANDASAVFLAFNDGAFFQGSRLFGAAHLAYYYRGLSFESEWNFGRFQMTRPGLSNKPEIPVQGFHATLAYFVTGEQAERGTAVVPARPLRPLRGEWGPGAIEPFVRFS